LANIFGVSVMLIEIMRALFRMRRSQAGMTGLETAIILIAFSTVAAVFGYAVLSAGIFSAERGKETIYSGLRQARANMEISGSVIVKADNADSPTHAETILFTVRNAIAGTPIDMTPPNVPTAVEPWGNNRCVISLTTDDAYYNNVDWDAEYVGDHDTDNLLDSGEQLEIEIDLTSLKDAHGNTYGVDDLASIPQPDLGTNHWFNIQIKPVLGSTMTIQRTLPAGLDRLMDMH